MNRRRLHVHRQVFSKTLEIEDVIAASTYLLLYWAMAPKEMPENVTPLWTYPKPGTKEFSVRKLLEERMGKDASDSLFERANQVVK